MFIVNKRLKKARVKYLIEHDKKGIQIVHYYIIH